MIAIKLAMSYIGIAIYIAYDPSWKNGFFIMVLVGGIAGTRNLIRKGPALAGYLFTMEAGLYRFVKWYARYGPAGLGALLHQV